MKKIVLLNGPNLGLLGKRSPHLYGSHTLADVVSHLKEIVKTHNVFIEDFQSNSEGDLVSLLNTSFLTHTTENCILGIIINPGAYTHTSVALHDALEIFVECNVPIYEVHISNIFARETFRHQSFISPLAAGVICGLGTYGYEVALNAVLKNATIGSSK